MAGGKQNLSKSRPKKVRPALSPEAEENQMIALAVDQAKKQLLEGTASSQIVVHFLKLASTREKLEQEKAQRELELLEAKTEALKSQKRMEELYADAIKAMKSYNYDAGSGE